METAQWDRSVTVRCGVGRFVRRVGACLRFSLCASFSLSPCLSSACTRCAAARSAPAPQTFDRRFGSKN